MKVTQKRLDKKLKELDHIVTQSPNELQKLEWA